MIKGSAFDLRSSSVQVKYKEQRVVLIKSSAFDLRPSGLKEEKNKASSQKQG